MCISICNFIKHNFLANFLFIHKQKKNLTFGSVVCSDIIGKKINIKMMHSETLKLFKIYVE